MRDSEKMNSKNPLTPEGEIEDHLKEISGQEQLYSIALFDILGFSNFVQKNGTQVILDLYNRLLDIIHEQESTTDGKASFAGSVVPIPISPDWKTNALIADANGFVRVCHFSDTFIIYVNYLLNKKGWWLADTKHEPYPLLLGERGTKYSPLIYQKHNIYLSFLQTCMEFFCQSIVAGIPLRGCVATGFAVMDSYKSIYLGNPLVEAARGEAAQDALGIAFGRSFNNYHPVYNDYFIPYLGHYKKNESKTEFLSPMVLDWPRYWRKSPDYRKYSISEYITKMNIDPGYSKYYSNAIKFSEFSAGNESWSSEICRDGIQDIIDYNSKVEEWYKLAVNKY